MPAIQVSKVTSTIFAEAMRERAESFRGTRISARLRVKPEAGFWYFLEYGTATRSDGQGPFGASPGTNYDIDPVNKKVLHWGPYGAGTFASHVSHPGIRPHPFVRQSLTEIVQKVGSDVSEFLSNGGDLTPQALQQMLINTGMEDAKTILVNSLAQLAPGTQENGKLLGETAASVFGDGAVIVASP